MLDTLCSSASIALVGARRVLINAAEPVPLLLFGANSSGASCRGRANTALCTEVQRHMYRHHLDGAAVSGIGWQLPLRLLPAPLGPQRQRGP